MSTILDVELHHEFWEDIDSARNAALKEAANTGGAVVSIESAEVQSHEVCLVGTIPASAINSREQGQTRGPALGSFHSTWGAVLSPSGHLGFLVVRHPITFEPCSTGPHDLCRVAVSLDRAFNTIPNTVLGPVCCKRCRRPIPINRLLAKPGAKLCTACQASNERITSDGN
jgi:hypothetical protein